MYSNIIDHVTIIIVTCVVYVRAERNPSTSQQSGLVPAPCGPDRVRPHKHYLI